MSRPVDSDDGFRRRAVLALAAVGLSGCTGLGSGGSATPTGPPAETPPPTATRTPSERPASTPGPTPTATPSQSPEPTSTPTARRTTAPTPTPDRQGITHETGTEFTVGEGDHAITYRIVELYRATEVGGPAERTAADGTFLIVVVEVTNPQSEVVALPEGYFRIECGEATPRFEFAASEALESDGRIDVPSLADYPISSGETVTGAVAFDVSPDDSCRLWLMPTERPLTPEHYVPIGEVSSVPRL
jgi:hypothetical protein